MPKKMLAIVFISYVLISHVVLPSILKRESFLFFSNWMLFSRPAGQSVADLSCDNGKTFIMRDHAQQAKIGLALNPIHYLLITNNVQKIREIHKEMLLSFCHQHPVSFLLIKNTVYSHFVEKKAGEIIHIELL